MAFFRYSFEFPFFIHSLILAIDWNAWHLRHIKSHIKKNKPNERQFEKQPILILKPLNTDDRVKVHNFHHHQCLSIWFFSEIYIFSSLSLVHCYCCCLLLVLLFTSRSSAVCCTVLLWVLLCACHFATPSLVKAKQ